MQDKSCGIEARLRFLENVVMDVPSMIFVKNVKNENRFVLINKQCSKILGVKASNLLGKNDYDLFPKEQADFFQKKDLEVFNSGKALKIAREPVQTPNGTRILRTKKVPLYDDQGAPEFLVGISEDITHEVEKEEELKKAKAEAEALNMAKDRFLANMSHEIRTPMSGIIGLVDVMLGKATQPEDIKNLKAIKSCSDTLMTVIGDILDYAKIESGVIQLDERPISLMESWQGIKRLYTVMAANKGLLLNVTMASDIPEYITTDETRLRQILSNLLVNAIKFTNNGQIFLNVEVEEVRGGELCLRFTVKDTGVGIDDKKKKELFEPFVQADSSRTRQHQGTGLGLSISKYLVNLFNGKIDYQSEIGEGTTFTFTIWTRRSSEAEVSAKKLESSTGDEAKKSQKVLIAEDNHINQILAQKLFERLGYDADIVEDGQEAVVAQKKKKYDIIFMDMQMPILDGVEATQAIRAFDKDVNIVGLTANSYQSDQKLCFDAGMNHFLTKPITTSIIKEALDKIFCN